MPALRLLTRLCCLAALATALQAQAAPEIYRGLCDASAAVALDAGHFVVANDENNTLAIYQRGQPEAVATLSLADFLDSGDKESDIEGAALVGRRIYWISSHGRNKNAKERPERYRFFATDIDASKSPPSLKPVPKRYEKLLDDLVEADALKPFKLKDAAKLAPEAPGGLNIEGLAALPDGSLLIGFRNPIPNGKALLLPLKNPDELLEGKTAKFGAPVLLALRNRGVRSIERVANQFLIVAGPTADKGTFSLYHWSGKASEAPKLAQGLDLADLRPEALFDIGGSQVQLLSDDGGIEAGGVACKDRKPAEQAFRSISVKP
ncbi:MAG: DUF3616 domain-containing protein [Burkholderiaceae bacterium]|nr:DUF3616 domain-containing protein [Burkholderiaceae bacterium]